MVEFRQALPKGFVLAGDYRIGGVLGQGGFGITYKAEDLRLSAPVAIKEFFPSELAVRDASATVEPRSLRDRAVLEWGRVKFLDEAKTLARFRHSSIVRVSRLFEANNTAYMVLDFEMGPNLAEWRAARTTEPTQADVDAIVTNLLDAVEAVHAAGILHRDIKPANVIMRDGASPVLIDFGAARQALSAQSKTVHAVVTPGYSPKEQYAVDLDRQGPWSDIYALGATLYFLVTGRPPPDALSRELGEDMESAMTMGKSWRPGFLHAIDMAMNVDSAARPQSVAEWREMLFASGPGGGASTVLAEGGRRRSPPAAALPSPRSVLPPEPRRLSFDDVPENAAVASQRDGRSRGRSIVSVSLLSGLLVVAGLGYWIFVAAPARDEAAWKQAASADTVASFDRYLTEQPSGRHVAEARQRQGALRQLASDAEAAASRVASAAPASADTPSAGRTAVEAGASASAPIEVSNAPVATTVQDDSRASESTPRDPTASEPPPAASRPAARPDAPTQVASVDPALPAARLPDQSPTPAPSPQAAASNEAGPFRPRDALPAALSAGEIAAATAAAPSRQWRFAVQGFGSSSVPGFSDQSSDFVAELKRLSSDKLTLTTTPASDAVNGSPILGQLASNRDLIAWQAPFAYMDRHLEFAIFSGAVPFGLDPNAHVRWLRADGARMLEETFAETGTPLRAIPCGIAGGVGAWFRKEVRSPSELRDLKIRAPRIMAATLEKLGARSVTLQSTSELAAAFRGNRIDANFDVTPLTDVFLTQARPASVYHYPGVHNPAYLFTLLIGPETWSAMTAPQRRLIDDACRKTLDRWAQRFPSTESDVLNQIRRQRIVVRPFTGPLRESLQKALNQVLAEEAAKSPRFKTILESYNRFRS